MGSVLVKFNSLAREYERAVVVEGLSHILAKVICTNIGCTCIKRCACSESKKVNELLQNVKSCRLYRTGSIHSSLENVNNDYDQDLLTETILRVFHVNTLTDHVLLCFYSSVVDVAERRVRSGDLNMDRVRSLFRSINEIIANLYGVDVILSVFPNVIKNHNFSIAYFIPVLIPAILKFKDRCFKKQK